MDDDSFEWFNLFSRCGHFLRDKRGVLFHCLVDALHTSCALHDTIPLARSQECVHFAQHYLTRPPSWLPPKHKNERAGKKKKASWRSSSTQRERETCAAASLSLNRRRPGVGPGQNRETLSQLKSYIGSRAVKKLSTAIPDLPRSKYSFRCNAFITGNPFWGRNYLLLVQGTASGGPEEVE